MSATHEGWYVEHLSWHWIFWQRVPLALLMLLVPILRLTFQSTALLLPQFLSRCRAIGRWTPGRRCWRSRRRSLSSRHWGGLVLRRLDARLPMATRFALVGAACWLVATRLTQDWVTGNFLPSQAMQALGQTLGMSSLVFFSVLHLKPADAMTFGALLQTARLFGGEGGTAMISTFLRVREQVANNVIGLHVQTGGLLTTDRLQEYAAAVQARSGGAGAANARATGLLAHAVRTQANVQSYEAFGLAIAVAVTTHRRRTAAQ